ncbi:MAG: hypothetical protein LBK26_04485 [Rickettsiales bacterium]|jgi:inorganic triphosphatase YgiF|nr:hypothetical protein [Rickettsiales bacterium]
MAKKLFEKGKAKINKIRKSGFVKGVSKTVKTVADAGKDIGKAAYYLLAESQIKEDINSLRYLVAAMKDASKLKIQKELRDNLSERQKYLESLIGSYKEDYESADEEERLEFFKLVGASKRSAEKAIVFAKEMDFQFRQNLKKMLPSENALRKLIGAEPITKKALTFDDIVERVFGGKYYRQSK